MRQGKTILLRPICLSDFTVVEKWSRDKVFCAANDWEYPRTRNQVYQWWAGCVAYSHSNFLRLGIEVDCHLVGYVDLADIKGKTAEIGIAIGESSLWGSGIGSTAVLKMMAVGLERFGITLFKAETHDINVRSKRMLEKIGFKEVSRIGTELYYDKECQLIQYSLSLPVSTSQ